MQFVRTHTEQKMMISMGEIQNRYLNNYISCSVEQWEFKIQKHIQVVSN